MKNYTQVYVRNSIEAAQMYCKAFGAEITCEFINESNTAYEQSNGGVVLEPIGELPWSKCCATVIDKYGVCWWISI